MESRKERRRKISVFTIFLWIALVITMSVVVVSGISKSNALEDMATKEVGITGIKRIKLDLTEMIQNEKITEQTKIEEFLEGYIEKIKVSNENNSTSIVNADITYVGSEQNFIGIYEINILNEAKYIRIESNEYEILNNNVVLDLYCNSGKGYYFEKLSNDLEEYSFIARKKDTKIVTMKVDFEDIIKIRGLTEQSKIEEVLENYASRLTGRVKKEDPSNSYITLKSQYIGSENSIIGVYEVEVTNDIKYIQMIKPYDTGYTELLNFSVQGSCDMIIDGVSLEIGGRRNDYGYITSQFECVYIQKILENVDKYNIKIEKMEEVTINTYADIKNIELHDNTNKIIKKGMLKKGRKFIISLSKGAEYDIVFPQGENKTFSVFENDKDLELKEINKPYYDYFKTIKQGENESQYYFKTRKYIENNEIDTKKLIIKLDISDSMELIKDVIYVMESVEEVENDMEYEFLVDYYVEYWLLKHIEISIRDEKNKNIEISSIKNLRNRKKYRNY